MNRTNGERSSLPLSSTDRSTMATANVTAMMTASTMAAAGPCSA
jgi:hypothetical protein